MDGILAEAIDSKTGTVSKLAEALLNALPVAICICQSPDGEIIFYNRHAAELWGQQPALRDPNWRSDGAHLVYSRTGTVLTSEHYPITVVLNSGLPYTNGELILERPDGSHLDVLVNVEPIRNDNGEVVAAISAFQDITERKRAEAKEALQQRLLDAVQQGVIVTDMIGTITYWNRYAEKMYGWTADEALGRNIDIIRPESGRNVAESISARLALGESWSGEYLVQHRDGTLFSVLGSTSPIQSDNGELVGLIGVYIDVSEQERAEQALAENERRFRATFDQAAVGMSHLSLDGRYLRVNQRLSDILGYTTEELLTTNILDIAHPAETPHILQVLRSLANGASMSFNGERRCIHKSGRTIWVQISVSSVCDDAGRPLYLLGVVQDISQPRAINEALWASESRFRTLVDSMDDIVFTLDLERRYTGAFGRWLQRNGIPADYFPGKTIRQALNAEAAAAQEHAFQQALKGEHVVYDWSAEFRNGLRHVQTMLSPIRDESGHVTGVVGVGRDITNIKQTEDELTTRMAQAAVVAQLGQTALIGTDLPRLMQETCQAVYEMMRVDFCAISEALSEHQLFVRAGVGWNAGFVGHAFNLPTIGVLELNQPPDPIILADLRTEWRFSVPPILLEHGAVSGINIVIYGEESPFGLLSVYSRQYRVFTENDINFLKAIANVLAAAVQRKRVETEVQAAWEAAEAASRSKSSFLANMSHELRTPLNSIIGMSQVLLMKAVGPLNDIQAGYANDILAGGKHLLNVINDVLDLSRAESNRITIVHDNVNFPALLYEGLSIIRQKALAASITIETEIDEGVSVVCCDRRRILQVVYNLLWNALKFTPEGGHVGVRLSQQADHVLVEVCDTGIGVAPENQSRLFRPFERLEDVTPSRQYEGTGLGLALSKQLVELHEGAIGLRSEGEGKGSTFWFTLPIAHSGH